MPHVDAVRLWQSLKNKDILQQQLRQGMAPVDSYPIDIAALMRPNGDEAPGKRFPQFKRWIDSAILLP
jgi:hypothetical protein